MSEPAGVEAESSAGAWPAWKRNLPVLAAGQLLAVSAMMAILPFIPFFVRELGVTDPAAVERWSGLIFSGPFLAAGLMSPIWGALGDRYGHKMMVVRALFGLAAVNFLLVFVQTPLQFWILRMLQGMITGFIPAALAITSNSTPPEKLTDSMGKLQASASAGRLVGPAAGGLLAGFMAFRDIFVLTGSVITVAMLGVIFLLKEPPRKPQEKKVSAVGNLKLAWGNSRMRAALVGLLVSMVATSMAMPIFPLFMEGVVGLETATFWTGIGFATVAASNLITATFIGRLADWFGLRNLLLAGLLISTAALAVHPVAVTLPTLLATRVVLGAGLAAIQPVLIAMISRRAPEGRGGGITGLASSATIFGFFLGPSLGGWLANSVGLGGVFLISAGILGGCAVVVAVMTRRTGDSRRIPPIPSTLPR